MSSLLCSQGMVLATAMAVSGTVILLALRLHKSSPFDQIPHHQVLRSCISSSEGKKKKKKRVHFAKDVVDPTGNGEEFRRQHVAIVLPKNSSSPPKFNQTGVGAAAAGAGRRMPENRVALYNGILRDRVIQRLAYSH